MSLSLDQERAELARLLADAEVVSAEEYWSLVREKVGVARLDQIRAAEAENEVTLPRIGDFYDMTRSQRMSRDLSVALLAGVQRCLAGHHCKHAERGDRPILVALPARVAACQGCMRRYQGALTASKRDVVTGRDRLCDYCLREPEEPGYRDVVVTFGPYQVGGSMCDACWYLHEATDRVS